jgi:hypothetical protein
MYRVTMVEFNQRQCNMKMEFEQPYEELRTISDEYLRSSYIDTEILRTCLESDQ